MSKVFHIERLARAAIRSVAFLNISKQEFEEEVFNGDFGLDDEDGQMLYSRAS